METLRWGVGRQLFAHAQHSLQEGVASTYAVRRKVWRLSSVVLEAACLASAPYFPFSKPRLAAQSAQELEPVALKIKIRVCK